MNRNFYPGVQLETIREESALQELSEQQWESLSTVGTLSVPELVFSRGSANLSERSRSILDELSTKLQTWPQYYLQIRGNASNVGDVQANEQLASKRAKGALEYLLSVGVPKERMRTVASEITGETRVTFGVGEIPY